MIHYRGLLAHEAGLLATVDRAETIEKVYRTSASELELRDAPMVVAGWDEAELATFLRPDSSLAAKMHKRRKRELESDETSLASSPGFS